MSFTSDVKHEIAQIELKDCCLKAELSSLIQLCSSLNITSSGLNLLIKSENATTSKRIWILLKRCYDVETSLSVVKKMNLKKNNIYNIRVLNKVKDILLDLGLYSNRGLLDIPLSKIVSKDCCAKSYLSGAFMATGSVNSPHKTNYHLEISANNEKHAEFISKLMERFNLPAKTIIRRKNYIVYLKSSEKIADFLKCIGAFNSLMKFEDIRIGRDFKNSLTRLDNCEVANEVKIINAAKNQLTYIEIIEKSNKLDKLDDRLKEVINLRKKYPDLSLNELSKKYEEDTGIVMSKSGMKHRFDRIREFAKKLA